MEVVILRSLIKSYSVKIPFQVKRVKINNIYTSSLGHIERIVGPIDTLMKIIIFFTTMPVIIDILTIHQNKYHKNVVCVYFFDIIIDVIIDSRSKLNNCF